MRTPCLAGGARPEALSSVCPEAPRNCAPGRPRGVFRFPCASIMLSLTSPWSFQPSWTEFNRRSALSPGIHSEVRPSLLTRLSRRLKHRQCLSRARMHKTPGQPFAEFRGHLIPQGFSCLTSLAPTHNAHASHRLRPAHTSSPWHCPFPSHDSSSPSQRFPASSQTLLTGCPAWTVPDHVPHTEETRRTTALLCPGLLTTPPNGQSPHFYSFVAL